MLCCNFLFCFNLLSKVVSQLPGVWGRAVGNWALSQPLRGDPSYLGPAGGGHVCLCVALRGPSGRAFACLLFLQKRLFPP